MLLAILHQETGNLKTRRTQTLLRPFPVKLEHDWV